jgi:hypothetical protein
MYVFFNGSSSPGISQNFFFIFFLLLVVTTLSRGNIAKWTNPFAQHAGSLSFSTSHFQRHFHSGEK